jgi:hypothetical protein
VYNSYAFNKSRAFSFLKEVPSAGTIPKNCKVANIADARQEHEVQTLISIQQQEECGEQ